MLKKHCFRRQYIKYLLFSGNQRLMNEYLKTPDAVKGRLLSPDCVAKSPHWKSYFHPLPHHNIAENLKTHFNCKPCRIPFFQALAWQLCWLEQIIFCYQLLTEILLKQGGWANIHFKFFSELNDWSCKPGTNPTRPFTWKHCLGQRLEEWRAAQKDSFRLGLLY